MSDTDVPKKVVNEAYITVAVQNVTDLEGCRALYKAGRFEIASDSAEARHLTSVALTECGDDFFKLWSVFIDASGRYYVFICDAAFSKIVTMCSSLDMLYLLCRNTLANGDSDSLEVNQRSLEVVKEMVAKCGDDAGKICRLYDRFIEDQRVFLEDRAIGEIINYLEGEMNRFKT